MNVFIALKGTHYVSHRRGGGHTVFGADLVGVSVSVGIGVGVSDTFLFARYLMNRWMDFNYICKGVTLGHDEELIRF